MKKNAKIKPKIKKIYDLEDLSQYEFLHQFIDLSEKLKEIINLTRELQNDNEILVKQTKTNLLKSLRYLSMFKTSAENRMFEKLKNEKLTEIQRNKLMNIFYGDILFNKLKNGKWEKFIFLKTKAHWKN